MVIAKRRCPTCGAPLDARRPESAEADRQRAGGAEHRGLQRDGPEDGGLEPGSRSAHPFCSTRCKLLDLGNWFDGRYRMSSPGDDHHSGAEGDGPNGDEDGQALEALLAASGVPWPE